MRLLLWLELFQLMGDIHDSVNVASQIASCSEGHRFLIFFNEGCRVYGCSFGENIKRIELLEELDELSSARERFLDVLGGDRRCRSLLVLQVYSF